jgi:hypothetical protein
MANDDGTTTTTPSIETPRDIPVGRSEVVPVKLGLKYV